MTHEKFSDVGFVSHHSRAWTLTLARVESCYVQAEMAHSFSILAPHLFSTAAAFARFCSTAAPWWTGTGAFWYMEFCSDGVHSGLQASDMYGSTPGLKTNCSRALSSYDLTFHNFCLPLIFCHSQITVCNKRAVMKAVRGENKNCSPLLPLKASLEMPESFFFFVFDDVKVAVTRSTSQTQPQKQEDPH